MFLKPFRGARINRSHPLARGLIACWLINEGGGNQIFDLTQNENTGNFVGPTIGWTIDIDGSAIQVTGNGTTDRANLGAIVPADPLSGVPSGILSVATRNYYDGVVTNPRPTIIDKSTGGNATNGWYLAFIPDRWFFVANTGALSLNTNILPVPLGLHDVVATARSGDNHIYVDGVEDTAAGGATVFVFPNVIANAAIGNWPVGVDREWSGWITYIYIWSRTISAIEVIQLHHDPYCFIEPSILDRMFFVAFKNLSRGGRRLPSRIRRNRMR